MSADGPSNTDDAKGRVKEAAGNLTGDKDLKQEGQVDPAAEAFPNTPKSFWDEEDEFQKALEKQREILEFFAKEGAAALLTPSASATGSTSGIAVISGNP